MDALKEVPITTSISYPGAAPSPPRTIKATRMSPEQTEVLKDRMQSDTDNFEIGNAFAMASEVKNHPIFKKIRKQLGEDNDDQRADKEGFPTDGKSGDGPADKNVGVRGRDQEALL